MERKRGKWNERRVSCRVCCSRGCTGASQGLPAVEKDGTDRGHGRTADREWLVRESVPVMPLAPHRDAVVRAIVIRLGPVEDVGDVAHDAEVAVVVLT